MMQPARIFVSRLESGYTKPFQEAFEWLRLGSAIKYGDAVVIKPNLTFPVFRPGVMTNPEAIEAMIIYLKNYTNNITIGESDSGGYNRFSMDEVFERTGIAKIAKHHGVRIVNMSFSPSRPIHFQYHFKKFSVPIPTLLLDETDLFVTMPVPKVHANAGVSVSLKNQWGVIQEPALRLKLHPYFREVIYQVNKALPKTIAVVDGKYGLTRNGPLKGDALELNWVLVGDNLFYVDFAVTEMMGLNPFKIPYLNYILRREAIPSLEGVQFNQDHKSFIKERFYLEREWTDLPGVLTFNSRFLAYVGYESALAKPLHWLLYKFREPFY
jgi:uncharacterized protein (DUF362 family)